MNLASSCKKTDGTFNEFPITGNGEYKSEDAKEIPDRIVLKQKSKEEAIYCVLITHIVSCLILLREGIQC